MSDPIARAGEDTKRAALGHVVAAVGSLSRAADHFGVSTLQLKAWLVGSGEVPKSAFLSAVEFLLDVEETRLDQAIETVKRSDLPTMTAELETFLEKRRR